MDAARTDWLRLLSRVNCAVADLARASPVALVALVGLAGTAIAATNSNAHSALGINLDAVDYWSSEQPFLDIFKTNGGFSTRDAAGAETNEEQYLNLDADGWPVSLEAAREPRAQRFTQLSVLVLHDEPPTASGLYPPGRYVVRYEGEGSLSYDLDASKVAALSAPGRDVIQVSNPTSGGGIRITLTSTDPKRTGNYLRHIQLVSAAQEAALNAGQVFTPSFLEQLRNFRVLRFMEWFRTNGSTQSSWSKRVLPSDASWGGDRGVPFEIAVRLANSISADGWFNVPVMADDDFMFRFAALVHQRLGSTQRAYVELSNEVWNRDFSQYAYATEQGRATWPHLWRHRDYNNNWYGMRTARMCDIWKLVWGADASRVTCVMAAQAANSWVGTQSLTCPLWSGGPCVRHGIGALAIAPYFGGAVPVAWSARTDTGLNALFASVYAQNDPSIPPGGWLQQALGWVNDYAQIAAKYGLPLLAYEGGQNFADPQSLPDSALNRLYIAANRDPRMGTAYLTYLLGWRRAGGQLFMNFKDVSTYGRYGSWGALESYMQVTDPIEAAPPKWRSLQRFMVEDPCWWPGCRGAIEPALGPQGGLGATSLPPGSTHAGSGVSEISRHERTRAAPSATTIATRPGRVAGAAD